MILLIIFLMFVFISLGFAMLSALSDYRTLTIPNMYCGLIAGAFVLAYIVVVLLGGMQGVFSSLGMHILSAVLVFLVTGVMFAMRMIGAGDSKFATVAALWIGAQYLPIFLFFMSLAGAGLGAFALYAQKKKPFENPAAGSWIAQVQGGASKVPYGIAIAFGMLIAFAYAGYFSTDVMAKFLIYKEVAATS